MIVTLADQYLAQNAGRRYPLADNTVGIADNAIMDFRCVVRNIPVGVVASPVLKNISAVTSNSKTYRRITVTVESGAVAYATLLFDIPIDMAESAPYCAIANADTATGELTVSAAILAEPTGDKNIPFCLTTLVVDSLKVDSIQAVSSVEGAGYSEKLSGDIVLDDGRNTEPYLDGNSLRLDIVKGGGIGEWCQSVATAHTCDNVLFTINGERPGSSGDIKITGKSGIRITPQPANNAIEITLDSFTANTMTEQCDPAC